MSYALNRLCDCLLIDDITLSKHNDHTEPILDQLCQHLDLHLSHHLRVNLLQLLVPDNMQLRILLLELLELSHHLDRIHLLRQSDPITQYRLQYRNTCRLLVPKPLPRIRCCQSRHRTDFPRSNRICGIIFFSRIQTDLVGFFLKPIIGDPLLHLQTSSGHFQICQAYAATVPPDLVHARRKLPWIRPGLRIPAQSVKQMFHALQLQRRSIKARKHQPLRHRVHDAPLSNTSGIHIFR